MIKYIHLDTNINNDIAYSNLDDKCVIILNMKITIFKCLFIYFLLYLYYWDHRQNYGSGHGLT